VPAVEARVRRILKRRSEFFETKIWKIISIGCVVLAGAKLLLLECSELVGLFKHLFE
jgi:hypothetical protein